MLIYNSNDNMDNQKYISIVFGETGVGKSSFINAITQKNICNVSAMRDICTSHIQIVEKKYNDGNYIFIDTPDFDDSEGAFSEIKSIIEKYKIRCILLLFNFQERRFTQISMENIKIIMEFFPIPNFWEHVLIIYTKAYKSKKFERDKSARKGKFIELFNYEKLQKFMMNKKIFIPLSLDEFYVDCDNDYFEETYKENKEEFEKILLSIKKRSPIFSDK